MRRTATSPMQRRCRWRRASRPARSACRRCRRPTGFPGLRVGWAVCRDAVMAETLLAAKEQMVICGPTLDEAIAGQVLAGTGAHPAADPRRRSCPPRDRARVVGRARRVRVDRAVRRRRRSRPGTTGDRDRHEALLRPTAREHGTYVGPGHWFEVDDRSFRLGYGWPTVAELRAGLEGLSAAAAASV